MAYVKLDTGILESTLWMDREAREVFITALLMARPVELKEPTGSIQVRSLDPGDYIIPVGWYGMVDAAGVGIVRRAGLEQEAGMQALERLAVIDPESRTPDHQGRRMMRVPNGYIVLNYISYRDRDHTSAERSRRYRDRQRTERDTAVTPRGDTRDSSRGDRDATHSDADADASKNKNPPNPPRAGDGLKKPRRQKPKLEVVPFDPTKVTGLNVKAWEEWIAYRVSIGKPLRQVSYDKAAKKLAKHGAGQQAAVDNSIGEGYQGLFAEPAQRLAGKQPGAALTQEQREADEIEKLKARRAGIGLAGFREPLPGEPAKAYRKAQDDEFDRLRDLRAQNAPKLQQLASSIHNLGKGVTP